MTKKQIVSLINIIGKNNISTHNVDLDKHSKDYSFHKAVLPEVVCYPTSTKQVSDVLKFATRQEIPVTPWGGGSSTEGNPIPVHGGIILDMQKMNKIVKIRKKDKQITVQPGIVVDALQQQIKKYNLFFPAAPGSGGLATIGGMIANNAGGMYAIKYGVVGDAVMQLEVVLANGEIITTGSKSIKSVSGYDLKHLFIGSEGTLGVITQAVLKLSTIPHSQLLLLLSCKSITDAVNYSLKIIQSPVNFAALEFMDSEFITYSNQGKKTLFPKSPTLLIQLEGTKQQIQEELLCIKKNCGDSLLSVFKTKKEIEKIWEYRKAGRTMIKEIYPDMGILAAEVGVPLSAINPFLKKTYGIAKKNRLRIIIFGHIGDGNFHIWCLYEQNNNISYVKIKKFNEEIVLLALSLEGTTTGEHGIGIGKRKFLPIEHKTSIQIMKDLKHYFDRKNILNPGKIFTDI